MISRFTLAVFSILAASMAQQTFAQNEAGMDLARVKSCLACHQVNEKRVGPAFTVIAERFAGSAAAQDYLANSIRNGSRGRWGAVPMPAQRQVNAADAQLLAAWILSLIPRVQAGDAARMEHKGAKHD
ncbi:c-type cytochrome [Pusillimonas sp. TS35]|uniref:c-type cytochrome n=1 Tax=Paracandidimonas lactea TaxID=2895524 RepID=UPI00136A364C|nr:c-type cytochrome [Paracandidimonas lactea]MYN14894.1 c-type cytochrome [Pusillimonas sp. TS35]